MFDGATHVKLEDPEVQLVGEDKQRLFEQGTVAIRRTFAT